MRLVSGGHLRFKSIKYAVLAMLVLSLHFAFRVEASVLGSDTIVRAIIQNTLIKKGAIQFFHFPKSVTRFYNQRDFQPAWVTAQNDEDKTWEALQMLDCVAQYGLQYTDYHPKELLYSRMHDMFDIPSKVSSLDKARYDMLLTDAVITFINHLHFGKLNPLSKTNRIDGGQTLGFCADDLLIAAIPQEDFTGAVLGVQPKSRAYFLMQDYMRLLKGQYVGDCYETPEPVVRKLAINMERLRWADADESMGIWINVPSFLLRIKHADSVAQFKVVVGKPKNPTPVLKSEVVIFRTGPEWNVPNSIFTKELLPKILKDPSYLRTNHYSLYDLKGAAVSATSENLASARRNPAAYVLRQSPGSHNALGRVVFRFQNFYDVYLHDTPEQQYFKREVRALSHGCIRVAEPEKLASMLLMSDGAGQKIAELNQAMSAYQAKTFTLKRAVPIQVTYLTCEIIDGLIVEYDDIYKQDQALEEAFYEAKALLTSN
ncbi:L,D-transpeptidase scaffold domain-containing protein [Pedobacter nyackensis]|uniref:L,D-transpeptidase catalytic domain n=1 Tax=Pedobacter nyackensis TaxID=475255 RepID=A0A1W2DCA4_9SPHI|nr:L,D-transpeptidase family protein [Pedobacter nyackensis]SMC95003.1 L,D-transpeptidase catalytic domain [Pedobacter nyackensis]